MTTLNHDLITLGAAHVLRETRELHAEYVDTTPMHTWSETIASITDWESSDRLTSEVLREIDDFRTEFAAMDAETVHQYALAIIHQIANA